MILNQFCRFYVYEESMRLALITELLPTLWLLSAINVFVEKLTCGQRSDLFDCPGPFLLVHRHELLIELVMLTLLNHLRPSILQQSIFVHLFSVYRGAAKVDIQSILAVYCYCSFFG